MNAQEHDNALIAAGSILGAIIEDRPGEASLLIDTLDVDEARRTLLTAGCLVAEFIVAVLANVDNAPPLEEVQAGAAKVIRERVNDLLIGEAGDDAPE
ncbi:hypothetical protein [Tsukamurella tyrosinosolvens]|uniref:hypothetical protein n=1 Tax=Tsukamurella tyrosinosolvens TaxID=57704 RepID=UPI003F4A5005